MYPASRRSATTWTPVGQALHRGYCHAMGNGLRQPRGLLGDHRADGACAADVGSGATMRSHRKPAMTSPAGLPLWRRPRRGRPDGNGLVSLTVSHPAWPSSRASSARVIGTRPGRGSLHHPQRLDHRPVPSTCASPTGAVRPASSWTVRIDHQVRAVRRTRASCCAASEARPPAAHLLTYRARPGSPPAFTGFTTRSPCATPTGTTGGAALANRPIGGRQT